MNYIELDWWSRNWVRQWNGVWTGECQNRSIKLTRQYCRYEQNKTHIVYPVIKNITHLLMDKLCCRMQAKLNATSHMPDMCWQKQKLENIRAEQMLISYSSFQCNVYISVVTQLHICIEKCVCLFHLSSHLNHCFCISFITSNAC